MLRVMDRQVWGQVRFIACRIGSDGQDGGSWETTCSDIRVLNS